MDGLGELTIFTGSSVVEANELQIGVVDFKRYNIGWYSGACKRFLQATAARTALRESKNDSSCKGQMS